MSVRKWHPPFLYQASTRPVGIASTARHADPGAEHGGDFRTSSNEAIPHVTSPGADSGRVRPCGALDRIGVALSTACAIHCLMTPVMAATASLGVFAWVADEGTESILVMVMLTMAVVSLGLGWRQHGRLIAFGWVAVAAALIGTGRILVTTAETPLVATGGMTIALAHLVNANLRRRCIVCRSSTGTDQPGELVTGS